MPGRILITGGDGELAAAIAARFEADGAAPLRPGRQQLDVADPDSVARYFERLTRPLELLIANAGLAEDAPLARCSEACWQRQMEANLHGAFRCARAAVPDMLRARRGHLIFLSSHSARHPPVGQAAYAAAKAGLHGLAMSLAYELGPRGIRVNTVLPGFLEIGMGRRVDPARRDQVRDQHALGRFNTAAAVADFIHHLHHRLPHTSGQCFQLDSRVG